MSALSLIALGGAAVGVGVWAVWSGWAPARPSLVEALARINRPVVAPSGGLDARVGAWARRLTPIERTLAGLRADLRVLRRSPDEQAALMLAVTLCGPKGTGSGGRLRIVGIRVPVAVPLWLGLIGAIVAAVMSARCGRRSASRRASLRRRAFLIVCGVLMLLDADRRLDPVRRRRRSRLAVR